MELLACGSKLFHPYQAHIVCLADAGLKVADKLYPSEQQKIANAVPKRVREFTSGRSLARRALFMLGHDNPGPIVSGHLGAPIWPEGVVGSISHSDNQAIAAVANQNQISALGIDIECDTPLDHAIVGLVCNPLDHALRQNSPHQTANNFPTDWAKLVFCAKESFYKAVFPKFGRLLDFKDAAVNFTVSPNGTHGNFEIIPCADNEHWPEFSLNLKGNWVVASNHIYCAMLSA